MGGFGCSCNAGYSGDGVNCVDDDECASGTHNCQPGFACTNVPGSFTCGNIDECSTGTHDCDPNAACTDTIGSFTCACNAGFVGDAGALQVVSSSGSHSNGPVAGLVDGDVFTFWNSGVHGGPWDVVVDTGCDSGVTLDWFTLYATRPYEAPATFTLQVAETSTGPWVDVLPGGFTKSQSFFSNLPTDPMAFPSISGRFVRLAISSSQNGSGPTIEE